MPCSSRTTTRARSSSAISNMALCFFLAGSHHGLKDLHIAGAATEISCQAITNFSLRGLRISFQKIYSGHHHPRCADAALRATAIDESLLNRVQLLAARDALDRLDRRALDLRHRHQTTVHNPAIDDDTAGATLTFATAFF